MEEWLQRNGQIKGKTKKPLAWKLMRSYWHALLIQEKIKMHIFGPILLNEVGGKMIKYIYCKLEKKKDKL